MIFLRRFFYFTSGILILLIPFAEGRAELPDEIVRAKNSIVGQRLVSHIDFLASWYCRGRKTGDPGMDVAVKYITTQLRGSGLEPAGENGGYLQTVHLETFTLGKENILELECRHHGAKSIFPARINKDFIPVTLAAEKEVEAGLVFAGYGISAPEYQYDDYRNLDVKGKIVVVMRHEPGEFDENSHFEGLKLSPHGTLLTKILNAQKRGAVAVLFVTNPLNHEETILQGSYMSGTYWPCLRKKEFENREDVEYLDFSPRMRQIHDDFGVKIPAVMIGEQLANEMLGNHGSLADLQRQIDKEGKSRSFHLAGKKVRLKVDFTTKPVKAHNIIAKVEGSDPIRKDEVVIVGAHYDHEGVNLRGQLFGGADDNASGTAGVMELARSFQSLKNKPKRSLVFMLFVAEEEGLLGSKFYVNHPIFPLKETIAMINLDMIGRNHVDQMSLVGKYQFPKLFEIINTANRESVNFELNFSVEDFILNSDHFPFMRANVPSLFFSSGSHEQLHRPEDTVSRIIPDKVEKVTQLVFLSLWKIAELPAHTRLN